MKKILILVLILGIGTLWFFIDHRSNIQKQLNRYTDEMSQLIEQKDAGTHKRNEKNPVVVLKTNLGNFSVELFMDRMPITAGNFLKLAKDNFYDGVKFHRVIAGFMIQGGDPNSKGDNTASYGTGGPGYTIQDEFMTGNANLRGTIAMANAGPNTGGSQFFINLVDNTSLNDKHPVFGEVLDGMGIVDAIAHVKTGDRDIPVEPVMIQDIEVKE